MIVAAFLTAGALMSTIKSGFYLPAFFLVLLLRPPGPLGRTALQALLFVATTLLFFALLFALHKSNLPTPPASDSMAMIRGAATTGLKFGDLFPRSDYLLWTITLNPAIWVLIVLGVAILLRCVMHLDRAREALVVLAILTPVASLAIYRNAFPYYYVFIMPTAVIAAGVAFDRLGSRSRFYHRARAAMIGAVLAGLAFHYSERLADETQVQRQLVEAVHKMFPEPTPYVDRNSMIASFPKVGFFMSTWGFEHYYALGAPIFRDVLIGSAPRFLIANHPALDIHSETAESHPYRLFEEDLQVLRDNFIPYWGPVHIAGKTVVATDLKEVELEVLIPGEYEIRSVAPVSIDGVMFDPGDVVSLQQGRVRVVGASDGQEVTLRIGRDLYRPRIDFPQGRIFRGF
jgi:hypothetical protein